VDTAAAAGLTYFDFIVHSGQGVVAINQVHSANAAGALPGAFP
jgi:hypothetical protein